MVGEVSAGPLKPRAARNPRNVKKTGPDLGALVDSVVVGMFGLVAVVTGHEHWLKDTEEVLPITAPIRAWIDQLDAKTLKRFEKNLAPTMLAIGCVTVIGPDIVLEMKERAKPRNATTVPEPGQEYRRAFFRQHTEGDPGARNGVTNQAPGSGWHSSIPAAPPGIDNLDV